MSLVICVNDKNIHLNVLPISKTKPGSILETKTQNAHILDNSGDLMRDFSQMQVLFYLYRFYFIVEHIVLTRYSALNWLRYYVGGFEFVIL